MDPVTDLQHAAPAAPDRDVSASRPRYLRWWDLTWRIKDQLEAHSVSIVAGGLALFALLAMFPSLAAAVAIYGLIASPEAITAQVQAFASLLPDAGLQILEEQLRTLISRRSEHLTVGVIVGILLALWSARRGMEALITAMNVAYGERDRRGFLRRLMVSSILTVGGVAGFLTMIVLGVAVPVFLRMLPLGVAAEWVLLGVRWVLLWLSAVLSLSALYRFAPHRSRTRSQWMNWGSGIAATLWILGSIGFAIYVRNFDSFGEAYGAIAGVVVMLMWFYVSAYVVILGAEINAELESRSSRTSNAGPPPEILYSK